MSEYWDHRYRRLDEGEVIQAGDEVLIDEDWEPASSVGARAPSPLFASHRWYRRLKTGLDHIEEAINEDILAMTPEEVLAEAKEDGEDTGAFSEHMRQFVSGMNGGET